MARLITPNNQLLEVDIYNLQETFKNIVLGALENPESKKIYEENYLNNMTKFSKEMEFCIKELGYKLYDPFNEYRKEALVYANKFVIVPYAIVTNMTERNHKEGYDNYLSLNDESVDYAPSVEELYHLSDGLIDDDGFVSSKDFQNKEHFAKLYLLNIMIQNKIVSEDYNNNRQNYSSVVDYLVDRIGIAVVFKNENNKYEVKFNENTTPKIKEFIEYIKDYEIVNNTLTMMKIEKAE